MSASAVTHAPLEIELIRATWGLTDYMYRPHCACGWTGLQWAFRSSAEFEQESHEEKPAA